MYFVLSGFSRWPAQAPAALMLDIDAETFSHPAPIIRVCFQKVPNLFFLNVLRRVPQAPDDIADQSLLRIRLRQTEEISWHKTLFEKSVGQDASG